MNVKSPTRSRDKALQTLYEIEVGGHDLSEMDISIHSDKKNSFYQDLLKGVIKEKREDRIVANQFNILIPVGIAIIDVEKVR